jgi:hypothetical protein
MKPTLTLLLLSICASLVAQTPEGLWKEDSPNRAFTAATRRVPDKTYIWRDDLDGFRLVVFTLKPGPDKITGKLYFSRDFAERVPARVQWSPDSRYLVLTTTSSGGHSPWHYTTYVLSVPLRRVVSPDDRIGPVVSPEFSFKSPDTVVLEVGSRSAEGIDFEHPEKIDVDLARLFSTAK